MSKTQDESLDSRKKRLATAFSTIRDKTGLSLAAFAKELGFKTASSIQRYASPSEHTGQYLKPDLIMRMLDTLPGRYKVTRADIMQLADPVASTITGTAPEPTAVAVSPRFGAALRQVRKQRGVVIRQIAELTGVEISEASEWEEGSALPTANQSAEIADFLRVELRSLLDGEIKPTDDEPLGDAVFISGRQDRYSGPHDVEKLGVVAAGDDGHFEFNGTVADYVARPRGLQGKPGVFSLEVISESMYPAYRKNDMIFCDRTEPSVGDDIVIETFPEAGAVNGKSYVKRLKKRTSKELVVEQFNPAKDLTFDPYSIKHVWRVVPNRELHGF